eukprot:9365692-Pyramimonas_sp.AAC.1
MHAFSPGPAQRSRPPSDLPPDAIREVADLKIVVAVGEAHGAQHSTPTEKATYLETVLRQLGAWGPPGPAEVLLGDRRQCVHERSVARVDHVVLEVPQ